MPPARVFAACPLPPWRGGLDAAPQLAPAPLPFPSPSQPAAARAPFHGLMSTRAHHLGAFASEALVLRVLLERQALREDHPEPRWAVRDPRPVVGFGQMALHLGDGPPGPDGGVAEDLSGVGRLGPVRSIGLLVTRVRACPRRA